MRLLRHGVDFCVALIFVALVVATCYAVFMRYFMANPVHWSEEVLCLLMVWAVMLGAVASERDNENLSIPVLTEILPTKLRLIVEISINLISICALIFVAYLAYSLAQKTSFKVTEILRISWYWIDLPVTIGSLGMAGYMSIRLVEQCKQLIKGTEE
ncbi:TRAP transporter small permease [Rhodobacteraceae bacterium RKSG542]|uniref:TRAP transporter small permease n=1 Tax=Pseudovibrio flavus TaxID=2529854 RepID=UPI0012BBAB2D|nr:TRAP transporter small permease [Pseudovibrio flavus]MTI17934.1 TRAP transporter small permease [Pseudovibrio flavus]